MSLPNSETVFNEGCDYTAAQLVRKWAHQRRQKMGCFTKPLLLLVFALTSSLIKGGQYQRKSMTVCIYILNKYLCSKNLIIHEKQFKSSNHLLFSGFFFRISSNTGAAPVISPLAVPYTNTLWVPPPSKFDISCTLMYLRLLTVQYQCKPAIYWTESWRSL